MLTRCPPIGREQQDGYGTYVAAERHRYTGPLSGGGLRGVVFCHAVGVNAWNTNWQFALDLANKFPLLTCDLGGDTWGNSTGVSRVGSAKTFLQTTLGKAKTGTIFLVGHSMGAPVALNYAKANPTNVAAIALTCPAVDMQDIHANNRGGNAASIAAAYGGSAPTDADNPADNAASFTGIPTKLWYSTDDTVVTSTSVTTFASAAGASTQSLGAVGHTALTVDANQVLNFLSTYA